jgi:hypothetical protein
MVKGRIVWKRAGDDEHEEVTAMKSMDMSR